MFKQKLLGLLGLTAEEFALAFGIWLCSLPLVALIILPLFGVMAGVITALFLLIGFILMFGGSFNRRFY